MNSDASAKGREGQHVEVVAVLATTSALDCARARLSASSSLPEDVMKGAMCAPEAAAGAAASGCSKLSVMLILFIKFLMQRLRVRR